MIDFAFFFLFLFPIPTGRVVLFRPAAFSAEGVENEIVEGVRRRIFDVLPLIHRMDHIYVTRAYVSRPGLLYNMFPLKRKIFLINASFQRF